MPYKFLCKISKIIVLPLICYLWLISGNANAEINDPSASAKDDFFKTVLNSRVTRYKKNLAKLAENPIIISAVKDANNKPGSEHMNNIEWAALEQNNPKVTILSNNEVGYFIAQFEKSRAFEKLIVRDARGNLVSFSSINTKPLLYNNADRPSFINGLKGVWSDSEINPDPTTKKLAVQISAPVMDKGKVIGVIHSSVTAE